VWCESHPKSKHRGRRRILIDFFGRLIADTHLLRIPSLSSGRRTEAQRGRGRGGGGPEESISDLRSIDRFTSSSANHSLVHTRGYCDIPSHTAPGRAMSYMPPDP